MTLEQPPNKSIPFHIISVNHTFLSSLIHLLVVVICMMSYSDPLLKITSPVRGTVAVIAL